MLNKKPGTQLFLLNRSYPPELHDNNNMSAFFVELELLLTSHSNQKRIVYRLPEDFLINKSECGFVIDFTLNRIVYKKGIKKLLGYHENEFTIQLLRQIYHPDDYEVTTSILKNATLYSLAHPEDNSENTLFISYRLKQKNGTYIKILSQSNNISTNKKGHITSSFIRFTDISFIDKTDNVNWEFKTTNLMKDFFNQQVYKAYQNFFTKREKEIIVKMKKGLTNKEIGHKLNISEHTVATHRKNILKKGKCHSSEELIQFCNGKGIL